VVGAVTHFYAHANAAIVRIESGEIRVGDTLHFSGHTTDFEQRVNRIELDHATVMFARMGQEVGIQVAQRAREHDVVSKL
jgi:putative protease